MRVFSTQFRCGEDYVVLELERIYHIVKYTKPVLETLINHSILPRAA